MQTQLLLLAALVPLALAVSQPQTTYRNAHELAKEEAETGLYPGALSNFF